MDTLTADISPASTTLDDAPSPSAAGAGQPQTLPDEGGSLRDTIAGVLKEQTAEAEKADRQEKGETEVKADDKPKEEKGEKPDASKDEEKAEAKPEKVRDETGKFAPKEAEAKPETQERKPLKDMSPEERQRILDEMTPDQRRKYEMGLTPAPEKFLPKAKELWGNVPNEVKGEVARVMKEHDEELAGAREFITPLVKYHQIAQQTGTTLHEALDRYVNMEQALRHDPANGFKALLENMEMQPTDAIGHLLKAFNVDPIALAQHMAQNPQAYVPQAPRQQQQPPEDPRVAQLQSHIAQMQQDTIRQTVIEPFKSSHPRYAELEQDIAFFLQSGKIPANLSQIERLEAAYDMAERINPHSTVTPRPSNDALVQEPGRAVSDLGGTKSIKSAPGSVSPDMEPERGGSIRDVLMDEVRRRRLA